MTTPVSLKDKRILVTGASSGIGRSCAVVASSLGATVIVTGRRKDALDDTVSQCVGEGHLIVVGDITDAGFVAELAELSGKIDGLVHAAGIGPACPIGMMTRDELDRIMCTNFYSFLELVKCYSRKRYRNDHLSVVAISSIAANVGWAGITAYGSSKAALSASVRVLATELATKGIRVNAVCPSNIRTPMYEAGAAEMNDAESLRALLRRQPLGLGEPEQVAWPVCFLLSEAASFITGVNLPVDGGYLAQ